MLVSISGAPLAGKTTLLDDLRLALTTHESPIFIADQARVAIEQLGVRFAEKNRETLQHYIGFRQLVLELELRSAGLALLDKSLIDALGYWKTLVSQQEPAWSQFSGAGDYGLILLCDHRGINVQEAVNDIDVMHAPLREQLAECIRATAEELDLPLVEISGSRDERLSTALKAIDAATTK